MESNRFRLPTKEWEDSLIVDQLATSDPLLKSPRQYILIRIIMSRTCGLMISSLEKLTIFTMLIRLFMPKIDYFINLSITTSAFNIFYLQKSSI